MQTAEKSNSKGKKHDTNLLQACNVGAFRKWISDVIGFEVITPDAGQAKSGVHYWVAVPAGKTPIKVSVQRGTGRNARYVETHYRLRPYIERFISGPLLKPITSAVKEAVRPRQPATLQMVVNRKLQQPSRNMVIAPKDVQVINVPTTYLLSEEQIIAAMVADSVIPEGVDSHYVYGVRVGRNSEDKSGLGLTTAVLMKVWDAQVQPGADRDRRVEVVGVPFQTDNGNLSYLADVICDEAQKLPNVTVLVDLRGAGKALYDFLGDRSVKVKRYGMLMGQTLPKAEGFHNRRAQCAVSAASAIKRGAVNIACPVRHLSSFGTQIPYQQDSNGRVSIPSPLETFEHGMPSPDAFEAFCMVFAPNLEFARSMPFSALKPAAPEAVDTSAPEAAKPAPIKIDQYLTDLRDDFAVTCPLVPHKDESPEAFAIRRWQYADLMIKTRPSDVRG